VVEFWQEDRQEDCVARSCFLLLRDRWYDACGELVQEFKVLGFCVRVSVSDDFGLEFFGGFGGGARVCFEDRSFLVGQQVVEF